MNLLLYMAPIAFVFLLPVALVMEPDVIDATISLTFKHRFMWLLLLVNSTMAYASNLTNFLVTKNTSALTLQVLGNAKGAVVVVISILLFEPNHIYRLVVIVMSTRMWISTIFEKNGQFMCPISFLGRNRTSNCI